MKKKLLASLLVVAMTAAMLVGCGGGDEKPASSGTDQNQETENPADNKDDAAADDKDAEKPAEGEEGGSEAKNPDGKVPKIAFVPKVMGQAWWDFVQKNVEEWAADTGIEVIYKGPTSVDAPEQVRIMTDLVNQGIDVLCFSPNDPAACEAICKEARDKGIIVISTEASGMENVDYDVEAFDEAGLGGFLMDQLAAQMGEEGQYITMVGSMTMESQNNWADAAVERQKEAYPNMELVPDARVADDSDAEKAYNLTKEMIAKYPDLKGILGTGSFDAPGAARAIQELGLTGKVFAISVAMPLEVKDYLEDGTLGSVALWNPGISAKVMLNLGVKMFNGEEIAAGADLGEEGYNAVDIQDKVIIGQGQIAVTTENVNDFGF